MPESSGSVAGPSRRSLLTGTAVAGLSLTLAPLVFPERATAAPTAPTAPRSETRTVTGHLDPGAADWVYVPVDVPAGVQRLDVVYIYDTPTVPAGTPGNSVDIGVLGPGGTCLGTPGFRGWSGGARTSFTISAADATPGYLPGPVDRGRWNVVLGPYQVAPVGVDYTVTVTLTYGPALPAFAPQYPPTQVTGSGSGWYRGDCHLHTVYSDGKRLPAEVAAGARAAGLDFIVSTDHNTSSAHGVWGPLAGPDLLILLGEEVTTRNGHVLALGLAPGHWVDWRYRARDGAFTGIADAVHHDGGLVVPAHPCCAFVGCRWKFGYADADAIEVWNGPWTLDDESAVELWDAQLVASAAQGPTARWLPAVGNSDAHSEPQVVGLPHTVVRADRLSRDALLAGLAAGRSWLADSSAVTLAVTATGANRRAGLGDRLPVSPSTPVTVTADVTGVPSGVVRMITDEGQLVQQQLDASGRGRVTWLTTPQQSAYVRVEVRHPLPDGTPGNGNAVSPTVALGPMAALTNPIWLGKVG